METPILLAAWDIPPGYLEAEDARQLVLEYTAAVYDQARRSSGGGWVGETRFRVAGAGFGAADGVVTEGLFDPLQFEGPFS